MNDSPKQYKFAIFFLFIVIIIATIATVYILYSQTGPEEVSYDFIIETSVYSFPWWNITFKAREDIPPICGYQIYQNETKLAEETWSEKDLDNGDSLELELPFSQHFWENRNFTLFLWFKDSKYMRFNLTLPEET